MDNQQIAQQLKEIGDLIELVLDEPFRARAYHNAARTLEALDVSAEVLLDQGELGTLPGFGKGMVAAVGEFLKAGRIEYLEELRARVPPGLLDLRKVSGLGPKKIRQLHRELGIDSIGRLKDVIADGRIEQVSGFGARSVERIKAAIAEVESFKGRWRMVRARQVSEEIAALLQGDLGNGEVAVTGPVRRSLETVDRLAWVVCGKLDWTRLALRIGQLAECRSVLVEGPQVHLQFSEGVPGEIHHAPSADFGRTVLTTTGPDAYVRMVLKRAAGKGRTEEEIVSAAGLPFLPPEGRDTEAFWTAGMPEPLLTSAYLRGVLHCHTDYSDGHATLTEMAEAAQGRGLSYLGVCDHSQSAAYAGGLSPQRVQKQHEEIDRLNAEYAGAFRIFKGIESDIRPDGSLDYPDLLLKEFEFVVASVHSLLDMDEQTATERTCRALAHPSTTILGHPTGRLLLTRKGFPLDWDRVFRAAANHSVAIELNANPRRLDLDWRLLGRCFEVGISTCVNPDAHRTSGIDDMRYGVAVARKAGTTPDRVLNCMEVDDLDRYFKDRHP